MEELRYYLEMLLDHQCRLNGANCPECQRLLRIYGFMQTELFSTVIFTETPIQPGEIRPREPRSANRAVRRA
jgi:hypothetical protein